MRLVLPALIVLATSAPLAGCHLGFNLNYQSATGSTVAGPCSQPSVRDADVREDRGAVAALVELVLADDARASGESPRLRMTGADLAAPPFEVEDIQIQVLDPSASVGRRAVPPGSLVAVHKRRLFVLGYLNWRGSEYQHPGQVKQALRNGELEVRLAWEESSELCEATITLVPTW